MLQGYNMIYTISKVVFLILILFASVGCNSVRYVPDGQYLLKSAKVQATASDVPNTDLENYIRQKPNKKIFGFWRFHLGVYNLSNPAKSKGVSRWLRDIGEEPVIFSQSSTNETVSQMDHYLKNIGYYQAKVKDTIAFTHKRASVTYQVDFGPPHLVEKVVLTSPEMVPDKKIGNLIKLDSSSSMVKPGMRYDLEVLRQERMRLSNYLRARGYYGFSREYVYFNVDTARVKNRADIWLGVMNPVDTGNFENRLNFHPLYRIGQISIVTDFNTSDYLKNPNNYLSTSDTVEVDGSSMVYNDRLAFRPSILNSSLAFRKGDLFSQPLVDKTIESFSSLRNFKQVKINFTPIGRVTDSIQILDCQVLLSPMVRQSYDLSVEGTYSSGNVGVAGNLIYKNRNLLKGAEYFEMKFKGAVEYLANAVSDFNRMVEFGVDARLEVPQSWIPFATKSSLRYGRPHSTMNLSYNYQKRPDFTRTIANAAYGYNWKSALSRHQVNILEFNYVNVTEMSDKFYEIIKGTYIENSFRSHMIPALNYTYTFSNQEVNKELSFFYLRVRPEIAGNTLYGLNRLTGREMPETGFELFNTPFSQYVEADVDFRYHLVLNTANRMAFRLVAGAGYPYGNSNAIPFEKKYFAGGSTGIRAWQVRSLGPGEYVLPADQKDMYPNQLGDIKLEASAEYRFDLFSIFKGAVFIDAGNIWAVNTADDREGAVFEFPGFIRQIALGTGFGLRADLSYFIGRLDLGIKVRDPGTPDGPRWIPGYRAYQWSDLVLNFGIGYPF